MGVHSSKPVSEARQNFVDVAQRRLDRSALAGDPAAVIVFVPSDKEKNGKKLLFDEQKQERYLSILSESVRPTDLAGYLGDNCFAVWLEKGDKFSAASVIERVNQTIALVLGTKYRFEAGIADLAPGTWDDVASVLERAEGNLKEAAAIGQFSSQAVLEAILPIRRKIH